MLPNANERKITAIDRAMPTWFDVKYIEINGEMSSTRAELFYWRYHGLANKLKLGIITFVGTILQHHIPANKAVSYERGFGSTIVIEVFVRGNSSMKGMGTILQELKDITECRTSINTSTNSNHVHNT